MVVQPSRLIDNIGGHDRRDVSASLGAYDNPHSFLPQGGYY